jgi:hypothetical protein
MGPFRRTLHPQRPVRSSGSRREAKQRAPSARMSAEKSSTASRRRRRNPPRHKPPYGAGRRMRSRDLCRRSPASLRRRIRGGSNRSTCARETSFPVKSRELMNMDFPLRPPSPTPASPRTKKSRRSN